MGIANKSPEIRYWTWYIEFPDGEVMVKQAPFVHELQFELKNTVFRHNKDACRSILLKGEYSWKDSNKVKHTVRVENQAREVGRYHAKKDVLRN